MTLEMLREELRWLRDQHRNEQSFLARVALLKRIAKVENDIHWVNNERRQAK